MKRILFVAIFLIISQLAAAQGVIVGVKGGFHAPTWTPVDADDAISEGFSGKTGWGFGGFVELPVSEMFSIRMGLDYSFSAAERNGMQAFESHVLSSQFLNDVFARLIDNPTYMATAAKITADRLPRELYTELNNRVEVSYLNLPVMAKFGWNIARSPVRFYVGAGFYASYLLVAGQITEGGGQVYTSADRASFADFWRGAYKADLNGMSLEAMNAVFVVMDDEAQAHFAESNTTTGDYNALGFGVTAQAGFSATLDTAKRHSIFLEATYRQGLTTMQAGRLNGQDRLSSVGAMIGYGFRFGK